MPKMKFDFFEVEMPANARPFESIIETIDKSDDGGSRTIENYDHTYLRLQQIRQEADVHMAEMIRIRMQHIPSKAKLTGEVSEIDLAKDEGICERTVFLYDPTTHTLVAQKSAGGVAPSAIQLYFEAKSAVSPIRFHPRLQAETMAKFNGMRTVKKLDVRVARVTDVSLMSGRVGSVFGALRQIDSLGSPSITVTISAGRGKRANLGDAAKEEVHAMLEASSTVPGSIEKLQVTGDVEGLEKSDVLDLLEDKMVEHIELPLPTGRGYSFLDIKDAALTAWNNRKSEITWMTGASS